MERIFFFLVALALILPGSVHCQNVISIGADVSGGLSTVLVKSPNQLADFSTKGVFVPGLGVSVQYYQDKKYGFSSGVRLISFGQTITGNNYYNSFETIDTDNKPYERRVWGTNISEKLSLLLVNIPIHFFYKFPINRNVALFVDAGSGISMPVIRKYKGTGEFTYKGYYPETGATLEEIPIHGFKSNVLIDANQKLKMPFVILSAEARAGISFAMNRYYCFVASVGYFRNITPPAKIIMPKSLSNEIGSFNSFLNSGGGSLTNISLSIGITKDILY